MRNSVIIQKLYQYTLKLMDYCDGYTYDSFTADIKLVEACVFNLSQMGACGGGVLHVPAKFYWPQV